MLNKFDEYEKLIFSIFQEKEASNNFANQILLVSNNQNKLTSFSTNLAKILLCSSERSNNCDCSTCQRIDNNEYYDLRIIGDFKNVIKKEQILEVIEVFSYTSLENQGKKIYIIKGIELATNEACNSLLKFLEEPFDNTYAILLTCDLNQVLSTIKSRCLTVNLKNDLKDNDLEQRSEKLTEFTNLFWTNFEVNQNNNFLLLIKLNQLELTEIIAFINEIIKAIKFNNLNQEIKEIIEKSQLKMLQILYNSIDLLYINNINLNLVLEKMVIEINEVKNESIKLI